MQEIEWDFKLADQYDYATPILHVDVDKIMVFYALDDSNHFIKVGGSFTWGSLDWFTWKDLESFTWNELEKTTDTVVEETGNGWYSVRFITEDFTSIIIKALAPHCAQCDENLYFGTNMKWSVKK